MKHLTTDDITFLDNFAKSLSRQLVWNTDHGTTATLRKPLKQAIADLMGVDLADKRSSDLEGQMKLFEPWNGTFLEYRHQRLLLRGLMVYWWTDLYRGTATWSNDRYQHLMTEMAAFGQELLEDRK